MRATVSVIFNARQTLDIEVDVQSGAPDSRSARDWLDATWAQLGCEPLRPSGKVLLLDKIVGIADAYGYTKLSTDAECAQQFARQTVLAVDAQHVTVDLPGLTVGF
jgi:hypothetical protein